MAMGRAFSHLARRSSAPTGWVPVSSLTFGADLDVVADRHTGDVQAHQAEVDDRAAPTVVR